MFLTLVAVAAALFAADPEPDLADLNARLGMPTPELLECRLQVRERGTWSAKKKEIFSITGLNKEETTDFIDSWTESPEQKHSSRRSAYSAEGGRRVVFESSGRGDVLQLASELNEILDVGTCTYCCWNNSSLEVKFAPRTRRPTSRDGSQSLGEMAVSLILQMAISTAVNTAAFDEEMRRKGVTEEAWEAAIAKYEMKATLTLKTDGKISADAPAEVSDDGKTMTLDLWKFQKHPPETWSLRIDGL